MALLLSERNRAASSRIILQIMTHYTLERGEKRTNKENCDRIATFSYLRDEEE